MASLAEYEAKAISARTKAALAVAKARGTVLSGLRWDITRWPPRAVEPHYRRGRNAAKYRSDVLPVIQDKQRQGAMTLRQIADVLNADGTPAPRGGHWSAVQVQRILAHAA